MIHGNAVTDADGVKNHRGSTAGVDAGFNGIHQFVQVHMSRDDFIKGIGNADHRPFHFPVGKSISPQQRTMGSPFRAFGH